MSHVLTLHWMQEQLKTRLFQDEDDAFSDQFGPISETSNLIKNVKILLTTCDEIKSILIIIF